ncbi:MAG: ACGX-repeat peptide [Bacteroidales bacterium]|nr:ACGX-repeat peptide [Bacteroidales bacterium]
MKRTAWNIAHTAQGMIKTVATPCGSVCGAGDKPAEEKPAACGRACGAGDKK